MSWRAEVTWHLTPGKWQRSYLGEIKFTKSRIKANSLFTTDVTLEEDSGNEVEWAGGGNNNDRIHGSVRNMRGYILLFSRLKRGYIIWFWILSWGDTISAPALSHGEVEEQNPMTWEGLLLLLSLPDPLEPLTSLCSVSCVLWNHTMLTAPLSHVCPWVKYGTKHPQA